MEKIAMKGQSAIEFMSTYAWAFLLLVFIIAAMYYIFLVPSEAVPTKCAFEFGISCQGVSVGTNSLDTVVNLYLINGQEYDLVGNTIATVVMPSYGTQNSVCIPTNTIQGGIIICSITSPTVLKVGQSVTGTVFLNTSACISGGIQNCQTEQPISYLGNFTTAVGANTNPAPITISLTKSTGSVAPNAQSTVALTAHVDVFGEPARGASVLFTVTSGLTGTSNTFAPPYVLSDPTGNAATNLLISSGSASGTITVSAAFGGTAATNTVMIT